MFSKAIEIAQSFTRPFIAVKKYQHKKKPVTSNGAYVVVNDDGWIISAFHLLDFYFEFDEQEKRPSSTPIHKKITSVNFWLGHDELILGHYHALPGADLFIGKLDNFDPKSIKGFPTFINPETAEPGTLLCKLGFPYNDTLAEEQTDGVIDLSSPLTLFPLEGMYTRTIVTPIENSEFDIKFIETSTPSLPGHSGGPLFDPDGVVWGIQSKTAHYPLNCSVTNAPKQFFHVGMAIHPITIAQFLDYHKIDYQKK